MNINKQQFNVKFQDGKIVYETPTGVAMFLELLGNGEGVVTIERATEKRSQAQNNAIHLYCTMVAEAMADAGIDFREVVHFPIVPTMELVKNHIWKVVQKRMFNKESTTELTKKEVSEVYDVVDDGLTKGVKIHIDFPNDPDN
ncbi:MAG: hypothetical protein H7831_09945 [Magnetococcus sp. WYHC-3]